MDHIISIQYQEQFIFHKVRKGKTTNFSSSCSRHFLKLHNINLKIISFVDAAYDG